MRITDRKTGKTVCEKCEVADSLLSQARGLMFSGRKNILFVFRESGGHPIHSFFVFFPFHAAYIDGNGRVVDAREVAPFTALVRSRKPARYLLEIADGTVKKIRVGDVLCWDGKFLMKGNTKPD